MASSISFSGLGSGIDFSALTDAIVSERMKPVTQLQSKSSDYGSRMSALKSLNGLLVNLNTAAEDLTSRDLGTGHSAVSSDFSIISPTADATATNGTVSVQVTRLASRLVEASGGFPSQTEAVLPEGAEAATFELRKGGAPSGKAITIDASNNSLTGLRDAINEADAGVTASIIDVTGSGSYQLVLTSKETGAAGRVELVETTGVDTGTAAALNLRRLDSSDNPSDFSNLDAQLSLNGLSITRPTNSITDALNGVTLELKKTGTASVTVSASTDIAAKLQTFVNAYNAVQDFISTQYKPDSEGKPTGLLAGDSTLRAVQQQLRDAASAVSGSNGGTLKSLAEIGVGRDENGKLTLDTKQLTDKTNNSLSDVRALLYGLTANDTGLANSIHTVTKNLSDNIDGTVQTAINGYKSSIDRLNDSITRQIVNINSLKQSLTRQFAAVDAAMGQLNSQSTSLTTILSSLQNSNKNS